MLKIFDKIKKVFLAKTSVWVHNVSGAEYHTRPISWQTKDSDSAEIFDVNEVISFTKLEINNRLKESIITGKLKIVPKWKALKIQEENRLSKIKNDAYFENPKPLHKVRRIECSEKHKNTVNDRIKYFENKLKLVSFSQHHLDLNKELEIEDEEAIVMSTELNNQNLKEVE